MIFHRSTAVAATVALTVVMAASALHADVVFTLTAYTADASCCGKYADGYTATMHKLRPGDRVVAVDPKVIPLNAWVHIDGMGWFRALDVGGAIKGNKIDVWFLKFDDAKEFGRQRRKVRWQMTAPSDEELARNDG